MHDATATIKTLQIPYYNCYYYYNNHFMAIRGRMQNNKKPTSGQSNLTTGRIAAAHRRFNGIRQVAPVCTSPNACFLGPARVQIPNGISIGSPFLHSSRAESRYTLQWAPFSPLKIALPKGDLNPPI